MSIYKKPRWLVQLIADLDRHEGFRAFAYPCPESTLGLKYRRRKDVKWGFRPGDVLLAELGEREADGRPWTLGHGFTRGVRPSSRISKEASTQRLEQEALDHAKILDKLIPEWVDMPLFAQTVLANMAYNLGYERLAKFAPTLEVFKQRKWGRASRRLKNTLWYKQTGSRARELCDRLEQQRIHPQHLVVNEPPHTIDTGISCKYVGDK